MKRTISILALLIVAIIAYSQTQQGCVKTRGRMINGKHIPGKGLKGAVVSIQGKADVGVKQADGHFSFPSTNKQFMVQTVTKKDYILVDADAAPKMYHLTTDTLFFLMETPEQLAQDTLDAMRRIRRTLQRQLQEREDEIEVLKAEKKITEQEYRTRLQKLHDSQSNNEKLISEMAKRYSMLDYDKLDEFYRQVNYCIEQGELTKADSLLRSRGDVESQIKEQQKKGAAIQQEEKELQKAKEVYKHENEEIARRCYGFYENFKMQHQQDSAIRYLELRANFDTTNAEWQFDTGSYCLGQNVFDKAELYYKRGIVICRRLAKDDYLTYEPKLAIALSMLGAVYIKTIRISDAEIIYKEALSVSRRLAKNKDVLFEAFVATLLSELARLYISTGRYPESEKMFKESIDISRRLAKDGNSFSEIAYAEVLNNVAFFYKTIRRFSESEQMYKEVLSIFRRLTESDPSYEPYIALTLRNIALLYNETGRFSESEQMYKEALSIYRSLAEVNPSAHEPNLAFTLYSFAGLYNHTQRFSESEQMYKEALSIYRSLAESDPSAYKLYVALTLREFASLCISTNHLSESEQMYKEALLFFRSAAESNHSAYEPDLASTLNSIAILYSNTQRSSDAEKLYKEALSIRRRLAKSNPSIHEPNLAFTLNSIAFLYSNTQRSSDAEKLYKETLSIYRRLAKSNPSIYEPYVAFTLSSLAGLYNGTQRFSDAEKLYKEALSIYQRLVENSQALLGDYLDVLYNLSGLYGIIKEYKKAYVINEEFIPYAKRSYLNNPEQYRAIYAETLGNQSFNCMFMSEFVKAEEYAYEGLKIDSSQTFIYSNLAASLLMQGKYSEAEKLYLEYKGEFKDAFLSDFEEFEKAGIIPQKCRKDVEKIKIILNE